MTVADDIGHVQSGLNNLWVDTANNASPAVVALQRQNDMQNIIDQENSRLQIKKDQIKGAVVNTQRVIALSESDRKRQVQFIYIILLLILGLLIYLFLRNIEIFFPFVPSFEEILYSHLLDLDFFANTISLSSEYCCKNVNISSSVLVNSEVAEVPSPNQSPSK